MPMILLFILVSFRAFSLSDAFLLMRPDRAYMSFITARYLDWHAQRFHFPILTPFERELVSHLDHWLVPGHAELSQLSLGIREGNGPGQRALEFRLWIHPDLREKSPYKANGFVPWFFERHLSGEVCVIGLTAPVTFESFCRMNSGTGTWKWHHRERLAAEHMSWRNQFPLAVKSEVRVEDSSGTVTAVVYHKAFTHVSLIPRSLLEEIRAHTLETAFSLERYRLEKDGTMTVYYP